MHSDALIHFAAAEQAEIARRAAERQRRRLPGRDKPRDTSRRPWRRSPLRALGLGTSRP